MKIKEITSYLESLAPLSSQESYDNSGLLVGSPNDEVVGVLISLDCIEETIQEAIDKNCNLIISHHPIIFGGLKKLNGKNYVERTVIKAIQNNIALYAIHTNLDNYQFGVNYKMASLLNLKNSKILAPVSDRLMKLSTYVPEENKDAVLKALYEAGAGHIGNYSECSFSFEGTGTYLPNEDANPTKGVHHILSHEKEWKVEVILPIHRQHQVVDALKKAHPYEEVAYEVFSIANVNQDEGAGRIGELENEIDEKEFLTILKQTFKCDIIRHTSLRNKSIKKVALCGGSGSFLLKEAKRQGADIFITGDFKYHEFFDAEGEIIIADIGHFESEQFTTNLLGELLTKKMPKFAVHLTVINTNPIKYF
ncbi:MAG: Nif3-like dinuclear metal center hexameric protein [Bacteroidota bacterium]